MNIQQNQTDAPSFNQFITRPVSFPKLKIIQIYQLMGQSESAGLDDDSCFRACLREKKQITAKTPAAPKAPFNSHTNHFPLYPPALNRPLSQAPTAQNPQKASPPNGESETSLQQRLHMQTKTIGQEITKTSVPRKQCTALETEQVMGQLQEEGGILGLQSKFSITTKSGRVRGIIRRTSSAKSSGVGIGSLKQCGSQQTSSKSQKTLNTSTRSRDVLLNKIEEIKQKYYERQLEIEIYQGEHEYQQQIDQQRPTQTEVQRTQQLECPLSARDVTTIRQNIIDKLNRRKAIRNHKLNTNTHSQSNIDIHQVLEIYSKEDIQLPPNQSIKSSTPTKNKLAETNELNRSSRSLNNSETSFENRVSFSQYSQQDTLHQIRQCAEEEQDYKSRMESKAKITNQLASKKPNSMFKEEEIIYLQPQTVNTVEKTVPFRSGGGQQGGGGEVGVCNKKLLF